MDPCEIYAKRYRQCVLDVANKYITHLEWEELMNMKQQFKIWKKEPDKLNVNNLYTLSGWRALYTQNLFMSRISTMLLTFRQVLIQPHVFEIMKCVKRVVSIGCGPGPDIAAVLMLLRTKIGVSHFVKVIGIDQFIGWRQYVMSLNKVDLDGMKCSVEFCQLRVEEKTLDDVLAAEMCVMSYTDAAIHTQKFWQGLKLKFSLIVILDQKKGSLTRLLRRENFRMVEYEYKGTKRFFYWVDPRGVKDSLNYMSSRFSGGEPVSPKTDTVSTPLSQSTVSPPAPNDEDVDDDDEEDDNSEQQRELAAIFDRLGNIGKMPVAQLNELDEVQRIRDELSRTLDSSDAGNFSSAVKPKRSYRSALEPQKHLSKERKNQLLKAKLRELGVDSEEEEEGDEEEIDDEDDGEEEREKETEEGKEIEDDEEEIVDFPKKFDAPSSKNVLIDLTQDEMQTLVIDTSENISGLSPATVACDSRTPIVCLPSMAHPTPSVGSAIPTVDRLMPNYSPPIVIPPIHMHPEPVYTSVYPGAQPKLNVPGTYANIPVLHETSKSDSHYRYESQISTISTVPEIHRSHVNCDYRSHNSKNRSFEVKKRSASLVLLSDGKDNLHQSTDRSMTTKASKRLSSCLGPVENIKYGSDCELLTKRFKCNESIQTNLTHFNSAAEPKKKVTDLRQLLNSRREKRSSNP